MSVGLGVPVLVGGGVSVGDDVNVGDAVAVKTWVGVCDGVRVGTVVDVAGGVALAVRVGATVGVTSGTLRLHAASAAASTTTISRTSVSLLITPIINRVRSIREALRRRFPCADRLPQRASGAIIVHQCPDSGAAVMTTTQGATHA